MIWVGIRRCCTSTSRGVLQTRTCGDDIMTHYHPPIKPMAGLDGFKKSKTLVLVHLLASLGILIPHVKDEFSRRLIIPSIVIPLIIRY